MSVRRWSRIWAIVTATSVAYACSGDNPGPNGAIVGTVLDSGTTAISPVVRLVRETGGASAVAVNGTEIFWVAAGHTIRAAKKATPTEIRTVADTAGATIVALVADDTGVYWLESGGQVMAIRGSAAPATLLSTGGELDRIALGGATLAVSGPNDAGLVTLGTADGTPATLSDDVPDDHGLANDGTSVFFTRGNEAIVRTQLDGGRGNVVVGLGVPRELAVDATTIYTSADVDGGKAIFQFDKRTNELQGDAAVPGALIPLAPDAGTVAAILLAHDGTNLVYANRLDGTVFRLSDGGATSVASVTGINALVADAAGVYFTADDGTVAWAQR